MKATKLIALGISIVSGLAVLSAVPASANANSAAEYFRARAQSKAADRI